jgi:hypothetical protein|tara:strand:+ start:560 stop:1144 length:585 start_codon:yes stop_codon:yes gene_type:complete
LTKTAFVLGNGTSRSSIELLQLKSHGTIYGCNALYREFEPDYLVAVDTKMILEINKAGYQHSHSVWTNPNRAYHQFNGFDIFNPSKGWSSGPTALWLASTHDTENVYIIGFDYAGIGDKLNNIYADTPNYKKNHDRATFHGNWLNQTIITCKKFAQKRYIRVLGDNPFIPKEFLKIENLSHITTEEFKNFFGLS